MKIIIWLLRLGVWRGDEGNEKGGAKDADADSAGEALQIDRLGFEGTKASWAVVLQLAFTLFGQFLSNPLESSSRF